MIGDDLSETVRREGGRVLATLARQFGSLDVAEEAVQDAVVRALETWPAAGIPQNPAGWLTTTAKNAARDRLRRTSKRGFKEEQAATMLMPPRAVHTDSVLRDDLLRLIFTCCHPALNQDAQVALSLRTICGLTTAEIAAAFMVAESTMAQRLVRAKKKIALARIPYRVPPDTELRERTAAVLNVIYLLFTEAHHSSSSDELYRIDLAEEAIYLGRMVSELMPDSAPALGLLALMLATHARRSGRMDENGIPVLMADQNRDLWDHDAIAEADELLNRALLLGAPDPYQLQAAIACVHGLATTPDETDWQEIVLLYDRLFELQPTPVVAVNRAIALAESEGDEAGWQALQSVVGIDHWHFFHAARAELLRRMGDSIGARTAYEQALNCRPGPTDARFLEDRLSSLGR